MGHQASQFKLENCPLLWKSRWGTFLNQASHVINPRPKATTATTQPLKTQKVASWGTTDITRSWRSKRAPNHQSRLLKSKTLAWARRTSKEPEYYYEAIRPSLQSAIRKPKQRKMQRSSGILQRKTGCRRKFLQLVINIKNYSPHFHIRKVDPCRIYTTPSCNK